MQKRGNIATTVCVFRAFTAVGRISTSPRRPWNIGLSDDAGVAEVGGREAGNRNRERISERREVGEEEARLFVRPRRLKLSSIETSVEVNDSGDLVVCFSEIGMPSRMYTSFAVEVARLP